MGGEVYTHARDSKVLFSVGTIIEVYFGVGGHGYLIMYIIKFLDFDFSNR